MSFNPVEFYQLASILFRQQKGATQYSESFTRTVISRAYYSAFLVARNQSGINKSSKNIHQEVRDHFHSSGKAKIANQLDDLRARRNDADYQIDKNLTPRDSGIALKLSESILKEFKSI
ncbi:MAG: hypothetical protein E6Q61_08580 [Nitrosomonas sp.]|nr:MAG: hypothetical protein E6Q61_08580 [Nitrosomonas sp.]